MASNKDIDIILVSLDNGKQINNEGYKALRNFTKDACAELLDNLKSFDFDDLVESYKNLDDRMRLNDETFLQVLNFCYHETAGTAISSPNCNFMLSYSTAAGVLAHAPCYASRGFSRHDMDRLNTLDNILVVRLYLEMLIERVLKAEEHLYPAKRPGNKIITKETIEAAIEA